MASKGAIQRFLGSSLSSKGSAHFLQNSSIPPYFLALARGLRNGLYYGVKVRLPHALVRASVCVDWIGGGVGVRVKIRFRVRCFFSFSFFFAEMHTPTIVFMSCDPLFFFGIDGRS